MNEIIKPANEELITKKEEKVIEKRFKKWCKNFLWTFSISAFVYVTWKLVEYFQVSSCGILDKCTLATISLTSIFSFIIYAIAEVVRK